MSIESHLRQAEHNEKFAIDLGDWNTIPYRDWVITALFYAALHLIEAYLESEGYLPARSHMKREAYIERLRDLRSIKRDYYDLQFARACFINDSLKGPGFSRALRRLNSGL